MSTCVRRLQRCPTLLQRCPTLLVSPESALMPPNPYLSPPDQRIKPSLHEATFQAMNSNQLPALSQPVEDAVIRDIANRAALRQHDELKVLLDQNVYRIHEVIEHVLPILYNDPDGRKQSMECLINNATNWLWDYFSATLFLVRKWEDISLPVLSIMLLSLDIALDTHPILEKAMAVAASRTTATAGVDLRAKALLIPLLVEPLLVYPVATELGLNQLERPQLESESSLPDNIHVLLEKNEAYPAVMLAAYLASPILLPPLPHEPYRTFDQKSTIERLQRQCLAKYSTSDAIAKHLAKSTLRDALKQVVAIAGGNGSESAVRDAREMARILKRVAPLFLASLAQE